MEEEKNRKEFLTLSTYGQRGEGMRKKGEEMREKKGGEKRCRVGMD